MIKTFFLIFFLQIFSCTTKSDLGLSSDDVSQLDIDPDQRALPAESSLDTAGEMREDMDEVSVTSPAPAIEDLTKGEESNLAESPDLEPDAPVYQQSEESFAAQTELGSGPTVRYVKAAELNIRERPDRKSTIVGRLRGGQRVKVDIRGGWARLDPGRWIRSKWLSKRQTNGSSKKNKVLGSGNNLKTKHPKKKSGVKKTRKKRVQTNN